ncbi:site-2 protease family protein [Streptomyces palmae]|uniref:Zinc metalloprotease n=1 Tax=Streptomyces palmae TaxID=1701085 RepID=A0A4Z0HBL6_9ACTN|nr:site-2 protease family protein [Streptomyces palmae]TGB07619.1 CBS domain-containing protein [Streptomyces palmae]
MRPTFMLGRILGVRVGVHWSLLVVFVLIAVGLGQGRLPRSHPGYPAPLYWTAGLVTAVVFFASLLAHELAHSVVARRNGVEVDDIVLWLLGGAARLKGEARTPGAELRIAAVGPATSLVLGGVFTLAAWLLHLASAPGLLVESVLWLGVINVLLAVFNTIPAAPLDGGRLLRAFLWWRTKDRLRATTMATTAGRVFGWFLTLLGLFLVLRGDVTDGLWLVLLGWFLVAAATVEGRQAQLRGTLAGIPVRNAMTMDPVTVPDDLAVGVFLSGAPQQYRHSAYPVIHGVRPVGLVTLDRARRVPANRRDLTALGDIMLPLDQVTTTAPDDPLADLLPRMAPGPDHRVLVLEGSALVGIVSASDINRMVNWLTTSLPRARGR